MKTPQMLQAKYEAGASSGSRLAIEVADLPVAINKMIVWCLMHPEAAANLLDDYERVRADETRRQRDFKESRESAAGQSK